MSDLTRKGFLGRLGVLCLVPLAGWPREGAAEAETAPGEWVAVGDASVRPEHFNIGIRNHVTIEFTGGQAWSRDVDSIAAFGERCVFLADPSIRNADDAAYLAEAILKDWAWPGGLP